MRASEEMIDALCTLGYGLYVVTSRDGEKLNGQLANAVCQVAAEPPKLVVGIHKNNLTHEYISKSRVLAVSVLEQETPMTFIGLFGFKSGRDVDKLSQVNYEEGVTGAPVVTDHAVTVLEARVVDEVSVGTHTLFIAEVVRGKVTKEAPALTYTYYRDVKRGKSSRNAPTYRGGAEGKKEREGKKEEKEKEEKEGEGKRVERREGTMKKYVCNVCGYVYDPEVGDPDGNVAPGTAFEDIRDDWVCPVCGAGKDDFTAQD